MNIDFQKYQYFTHCLNTKGGLLEIPLRRGCKDAALIDAITFTVKKQTIELFKGLCLSDAEFIAAYSEILIDIFGFGVSEKRQGKGRYFYKHYYSLGSQKADYGTVHIGGQNDTVLVELTGTACQAAKVGWEMRLYEFLKNATRPQITRIDVAHDFFHGEYTPEQAMHDHDKGLFDRANKTPKSQCIGTAWRKEDGTGKTFNVGTRGSFQYTTKNISVGRAFMPDIRNHGTLSGMNARPTKCRVLKGSLKFLRYNSPFFEKILKQKCGLLKFCCP